MRVLCIIRERAGEKKSIIIIRGNSQTEGNFKFPSRVLPGNRRTEDTVSMLFLLSFDAGGIIHLRYLA